jgi:hypothetical protein
VIQVCSSLCAHAIGTDLVCLQLVALSQPISSCCCLCCLLHHPCTLVSHPSCHCHHPLALPIALNVSYSPLWPPDLVLQLHIFVVVVAQFTGHCRSCLLLPCSFHIVVYSLNELDHCISSCFFISSQELNWSGGRRPWSSVDGLVRDRNQMY